ncbi:MULTISPECIES: hypothetical protein [Leptospira]|uniref:Uncharacterized protein n=2 Tax=Leptospira TaxID=171 RepID=M6KPE2_LEPIR|nr:MULTISPECIES: hypothetical protein [Leptospira]EMM72660.1 hypothetical protein LEP1GSC038_2020 [Leptospira weilii str. 2006001855]EMN29677.1 hypothetical protein LEP1GSC083_2435 [Leptospira interrogans serovar Pyrogenes str. L0374]MCL8267167.1 hypothetical protein [Leptospira weilii]
MREVEKKLSKTQKKKILKITEKLRSNPELIELAISQYEKVTKGRKKFKE